MSALTKGVRRRHVLLGSAALAACKAPAGCGARAGLELPLPPGQIVGQVERMGHVLRQMRESPPWRDDAPTERRRVVVVGGGVAGLACARSLRRGGISDVLVLELDDRAGGTATWGENATSAYPWGAHYVTLPLENGGAFGDFLVEAGACTRTPDGGLVGAERALCREPEERLYLSGAWHDGLWPSAGASAVEVHEFEQFRAKLDALSMELRPNGTRLFRFPLADGSAFGAVGDALDKISAAAWLEQQSLVSPRLAWMINYACRDDYGCLAKETSALAALAYFAGRLRAPGAEPQPVLSWPAGNGHLVQALAKGAEIRGGALVTAVHADGRLSGVDAHGKYMQVACESVVVTVPSFIAARIVQGEPDHVRNARMSLSYAPWWVANLTLSEHPANGRGGGVPIAWDNVMYDSVSVGYVVATHAAGTDSGPTVMSYYMPMAGGDPAVRRQELLSASYENLAAQCLDDLESAHPGIRNFVERIEIRKWGHAMVRPVPGLLSSPGLAQLRAAHGKVHYAHTDLSGLALFDEAFAHGERAAAEVRYALQKS